jgi:hypothetical protein
MRNAAVLMLLGCLMAGFPSSAAAQEEPEVSAEAKEEAAAKYREGLSLFEAEKPGEALPLFRKALAITNSPNARLMVAMCLKQMGQVAEAYREMKAILETPVAQDNPKYERTLESARAALEQLQQEVGKLTIKVEGSPPGLQVTVDGESVEVSEDSPPIVLKGGDHELVATADGLETDERTVHIEPGHGKVIKLALEPPASKAEPEPEPEEPPPPTPPEPDPAGTNLQTIGYVVGGVGVVGLGVFATTGLMAKSKYDSVNDACDGERCEDPKYGDDIDSGKTLQTVANVSLIVGAAGVLTGSALILFGGSSQTEQPAVAAAPLPGGAYLGYSGRF